MTKRIPLGDMCVHKIDMLSSQCCDEIEYIDISSVDNIQKKIVSSQTIPIVDAPSRAKQLINKGDVLVSTVRPNLNAVAIVDRETDNTLVASTGYCILRTENEIHQKYIYYFCQSPYFVGNMVKQATGASYPAVSSNIVKNSLIPDYDEYEKKKIVASLDKVSILIDERKKQLQKLEELVKSRFVEMFGDKESNPFGWEQCSVGECCTLKSGTSLPAEVENEGGPIPYVKVGDMNYPGNEKYITTSSRYVSEETAGKGLFEVGSVLFPKRGGAIGTNKKRMTKLPVCADLNVMGVSSNGKLLPEYLFAYFDLIDLGALADGSSVPQINNKNIAPLVICLPPIELQEQFAAFVEQTDKSKFAVQQSLDKLETLKKSLMQEYFG